jgi:hypothetical protein
MLHLHKFATMLACAVLILACQPAAAEDKKDDKKPSLSGTWAKKDGDLKFEFSGKDAMKIFPHGDKANFAITCKYTLGTGGLVKVELKELEGSAEIKEKAKGHLPAGLKFSFIYKVKDSTAILEDVKGEDVEILKSHLEGEYEKK